MNRQYHCFRWQPYHLIMRLSLHFRAGAYYINAHNITVLSSVQLCLQYLSFKHLKNDQKSQKQSSKMFK